LLKEHTMTLSTLIRDTQYALASASLLPEDRLDIVERALTRLEPLTSDRAARARTHFLQVRASTLELCDTRTDLEDDAYDPDSDDAAWDTAALYDGPMARSLAAFL